MGHSVCRQPSVCTTSPCRVACKDQRTRGSPSGGVLPATRCATGVAPGSTAGSDGGKQEGQGVETAPPDSGDRSNPSDPVGRADSDASPIPYQATSVDLERSGIFRVISRRCLRFICCQWPCVGWYTFLFFSCCLGFMLPLHVEFNLARPGRRNYSTSPAGTGPYPFQDNAATIYTIANTGAMLLFGQERSKGNAALAAEPCCAPNSNSRRDTQDLQAL